MKKVLSRGIINYILLQMIAISFVCLMLFIDLFIQKELVLLRFGIQSVTLVVFLIYELILHYSYKKARDRQNDRDNAENTDEPETEETHSHNEKYLWFEILLLLDTIFIVSIITTVFNDVNLFVVFIISLLIYYIISMVMKPYFGINHENDE